MAELFDDISRVVGSQIPRRRALRLIGGGLAGAALTALWPRRTEAGPADCPDQSSSAQADQSFRGSCSDGASVGKATEKACAAAARDTARKCHSKCAQLGCATAVVTHSCKLLSCANENRKKATARVIDNATCKCTARRPASKGQASTRIDSAIVGGGMAGIAIGQAAKAANKGCCKTSASCYDETEYTCNEVAHFFQTITLSSGKGDNWLPGYKCVGGKTCCPEKLACPANSPIRCCDDPAKPCCLAECCPKENCCTGGCCQVKCVNGECPQSPTKPG